MKNNRFQFTLTACFLVFAFLFAGCPGSSDDPDPGTGPGTGALLTGLEITLPTGGSTTVPIGGTMSLSVTYTPVGTTLTGVMWSSSDATIASVSNIGLVSGLKEGTAIITATSTQIPTISNKITIEVKPVPVAGITIANNTTGVRSLVQYDNTVVLTATLTPGNATNKAVTWTSADPSKVTVTQQAAPNELRATLNALLPTDTPVRVTVKTTDGDFTDYCDVTVTPFIEVTGINLSDSTLTVMETTRKTLTATCTPAEASSPTVSWSSSDPTKVSVDTSGRSVTVTGIAETTTPVTITATATKRDETTVTATCQVTVIPLTYTTLFFWDADDDDEFEDIPWEGTRTIGGFTVRSFSTNSANDASITSDPVAGTMKAIAKDAVLKPDPQGTTEYTMEKAGYLLVESTVPCLQIGSDAYTRTTTSSGGTNKDGEAVAGEFNLTKPYRITVEYTTIVADGTMLVAVLNNTGSLNNENSVLRRDSGEFMNTFDGGQMLTFVSTRDPSTYSYFDEALPLLEKAFFIVRKASAGSMVVHSIKLEVADTGE